MKTVSLTADELQQVRTALIVSLQTCEDPFVVKLLAQELREWANLAPAEAVFFYPQE